jgi:hypothetical protein
LTVEFNPLTQVNTVTSEPEIIDIHEGYFPIRPDSKLTSVRNWLKQKNPDLSSSVMIRSYARNFMFGTSYKIVFKVMTKCITYIVYYDQTTATMTIWDES